MTDKPKAFRADIEGLRAVAVLGVVVFHLAPDRLTGGFAGVDVFFVISGYLITRGIVERLRSGSFGFADFYARRIRRLLPAYLVMIAFVFAAAPFVQVPSEMEFLAASAAASILYVSNILFMFQDSYFSAELKSSPLLHTWSLSVEEQFYIVFPALLVGLFAFGRRLIVPLLLAIGAGSFALAVWLAATSDAFAFFLSPSRFWQFLFGGLLVFLPPLALGSSLRDGLTLTGLGLIAATFVLAGAGTAFPLVAALPPTLGAALVIAAGLGGQGRVSAALLGNRAARHLGAISYSLYLWHWPIIVFYGLRYGPTGLAEKLALLALCLVVATASLRLVEDPFRRYPLARRPRLFAGAAAASVLVLLAGGLTVLRDGFPGRFAPSELTTLEHAAAAADATGDGPLCFLQTSEHKSADLFDEAACLPDRDAGMRVALLGDSHSDMYADAMQDLWPEAEIARIHASGCRPLVEARGNETCEELMDRAFTSYLPQGDFDYVVLAGRWRREETPDLLRTVEALRPLETDIVVLGPVVEYEADVPRLIAFGLVSPDGRGSADWSRAADKQALDRQMAEALAGTGAEYHSVTKALCRGGPCQVLAGPGVPMQFDYGHLTEEGARIVLARLHDRGLFDEAVAIN